MLRNQNPTPHIRKIIAGLFLVLTVALAGITKCSALPVQYNPDGSPFPAKEMEFAIKYATEFVWCQYIDACAPYVGQTGEESADGKIIVRWEKLPLFEKLELHALEPGVTRRRADLSYRPNTTLGYATWTTRNVDGSLVKAEIVLNTNLVPERIDKCVQELINHEFGHIFRGVEGHSGNEKDVMYSSRGACRYSPSLSDLAFVGKGQRLKSCHVELTPSGDLEYLDLNGQRISLFQLVPNRWAWQSIEENTTPHECHGVYIDGKEVWAEVKTFNKRDSIVLFREEDHLYRAVRVMEL